MNEPPPHTSPSYGKKRCCGSHCDWSEDSTPMQPCWGDVKVRDEIDLGDGHAWVHACEGHAEYCDGKPYIPEPKPKDEAQQ